MMRTVISEALKISALQNISSQVVLGLRLQIAIISQRNVRSVDKLMGLP